MSHVYEVDLVMDNIAAIKAACQELGMKFKEAQKTYRWFGTSVGDYPLPKGMTVADLGKCEHAIEVEGSHYDIGLRKCDGGYKMVFDFFGTGQRILDKVGGQECTTFKNIYGVHKATLDCQRRGLKVSRHTEKSGAIVLRVDGRFQ